MALTLIEAMKAAQGREETYKAAIMELYARSSDLLQALPFESISGNALSFNREKTLPDVGFRGVNEAFDESTGTVDPQTERLTIAGGDLDVDRFIVNTGAANARSTQEALKVKSLSLSLTKQFIKGDSASNVKSFDGLQARVTGDQLIANATGSGGAALSLLKLDELIDVVDNPTHLMMNKTMRRLLTAAARNPSVSGYITYDVDAFGRKITKYNDLPILLIDRDNTNTDIMPFSEAHAGGGTANGTSIYCVSLADDGVVGIQNGEMDVRDLGELDSKPVYRTRVEWYVSMAIYRLQAAARLYSITNAAVTA